MDDKIKQLLYDSFERQLSSNEQDLLDKALADSSELQAAREDIIEMRKRLSDLKEQKFESFFADRVMSKIREIPEQNGSNEFFENIALFFKPVAITATVIIIIVASLNLMQGDQISLESVIAAPDVTISDAYDPIVEYNLE